MTDRQGPEQREQQYKALGGLHALRRRLERRGKEAANEGDAQGENLALKLRIAAAEARRRIYKTLLEGLSQGSENSSDENKHD